MSEKQKIIKEIYTKNNANFYSKVILFTKGFKAVGELYDDHTVEDIIALKNAKVYSYATNCECETNPATKELPWLNIFAEDIIAFSFVEK